MSLKVLESYSVNCFVPHSKNGMRKFGVPSGGCWSERDELIVRTLVGASKEVMLEVPVRMALHAESNVLMGIAGRGEVVLDDGRKLSSPARIELERGEVMSILPESGYRLVLAISGLIHQVELTTEVKKNLSLEVNDEFEKLGSFSVSLPLYEREEDLSFLPCGGVEIEGEYEVSPDSNRVGVRLIGGKYLGQGLSKSQPVVFGSIQATPDGTLLIHGPDGPTIGGYEVVGHVCSASREMLANLAPEGKINLKGVTDHEAKKQAGKVQERNVNLKKGIKKTLQLQKISNNES